MQLTRHTAIAARLPAVEAALPALTMRPDQLKEAYYQGSRLAGIVGSAGDWAASGKQKAAAVGDGTAQKTAALLHTSLDVLHGLLDRTEHYMDRYVAPAGGHSSSSATATTSDASEAAGSGGLSARRSAVMAKTSAAMRSSCSSTWSNRSSFPR